MINKDNSVLIHSPRALMSLVAQVRAIITARSCVIVTADLDGDLIAVALSTPRGGGDKVSSPSPSPPPMGFPIQATKPYTTPKYRGSFPALTSLTGLPSAWLGSLCNFNFRGKLAILAKMLPLAAGINFSDGAR